MTLLMRMIIKTLVDVKSKGRDTVAVTVRERAWKLWIIGRRVVGYFVFGLGPTGHVGCRLQNHTDITIVTVNIKSHTIANVQLYSQISLIISIVFPNGFPGNIIHQFQFSFAVVAAV